MTAMTTVTRPRAGSGKQPDADVTVVPPAGTVSGAILANFREDPGDLLAERRVGELLVSVFIAPIPVGGVQVAGRNTLARGSDAALRQEPLRRVRRESQLVSRLLTRLWYGEATLLPESVQTSQRPVQ